ncbi:MAG: YceI family protein [Acidimicrobiales bacterium]
MRRTLKLIGIPVALVVLVVGCTWAYIQFGRDDAPERLTVDSAPGSSVPGSTGGGTSTLDGDLEGTWKVAAGSQAGYRVKEILFGQDAEAVGRTEAVTGSFELSSSAVTAGSFAVDMATVASDENRRDNQFRGRIMDVATYPKATFELTDPIALQSLPVEGAEAKFTAKGTLTLRGTTKPVTLELTAKRTAGRIQAAGSVPVVFAEWGIPNPSFGPAKTGDRGELEFLLLFEPQP